MTLYSYPQGSWCSFCQAWCNHRMYTTTTTKPIFHNVLLCKGKHCAHTWQCYGKP